MGEILIGTAGWSYEDWKGRVYPSRPGTRFDPLAYLTRYFDLIEINVSFYRLPRPDTVSSWLRRSSAAPNFRFLIKAPRSWTHPRRDQPPDSVAAFRLLAELLAAEGRLAAILLQFPWSFRNERASRDRVATLREALHGLPVAVEVRHESFGKPAWPAWLAHRDCLAVNVDQPDLEACLRLTNWQAPSGAYYRLHGRNRDAWFDSSAGRDGRYDYLYGPEELAAIAAGIREVASSTGQVLVVANNHYLGQAAVNGLQLKALFSGERVAVPASLLRHYPQLASIALPCTEDQGELFGI